MEAKIVRGQYFLLVGAGLLAVIWAISYSPVTEYPSVRNLTPLEALALIEASRVLILDVREQDAFDKDHLPGAISVPIGELDQRMKEFEAHKAEEIVVYCNKGSPRGPRATDKMNNAGYPGAKNLEGGIEGWRKAELATVKK